MRLFRTIAIVAIVVGFPALSWYYLSTGAEWRKAGWQEMSNTVQLQMPSLSTVSGDSVDAAFMQGRYMIAVDFDVIEDQQLLTQLAGQFGTRKDVLYAGFAEKPGDELERWQVVDCTANNCEPFRSIIFEGGANAALIDSSMQLRKRYDLAEDGDVKKLLEHGAILFPTEKREQLELIRNKK